MTGRHLPILTNTAEGTFKACARLYQHRYVDLLEPVDRGEALRFGTLTHASLEAWWKAKKEHPTDQELWLEAAMWAIENADGDADEWDRCKALALMRGYHFRWADEPCEVLAIEVEFLTDIVNPDTGHASKSFRFSGKIDVLIRLPNGEDAVVEHKTSTEDISVGSPYWKKLRIDPQVSAYFMGAKAIGFDVRTCVYDVLTRPGLRPLKATPEGSRKYTKEGKLYANQRDTDETLDEYFERLQAAIAEAPQEYYARGIVSRLEEDEKDAAYDRWQTAINIREATRTGRFPRNPGACQRWGRTCSFFPICVREASADDPLLFRRLEAAHPELSNLPTKE